MIEIPEALIQFLPSIEVLKSSLFTIAGAVLTLIIGWIIGFAVGRITKEIILRLKVDQYISRGKRPLFRLSDIFSLIFKWWIYVLAIWTAVGILGIPALTEVMQAIVMNFIPGLVKAIVIVMVGYVIGEYVKKQIEATKIEYSGLMGNVFFFFIVYVAIAMALPLMGIDPTILLIIMGSIGVGIAVALGLGLKDIVATIAKKYEKKLRR